MNKTLRALLVAAACLLPTLGLAATVSLIAPADGSSYTAPASVLLAAAATDSSVTSVEFYNGSTLIGAGAATLSIGGYTLTWSNVAAGSYSLTAKATDYWGAVTTTAPVTITVNPPPNVAPTVSLSTPATGSTYTAPASITLTASAADSDGSIAAVEFYDGTAHIGTGTLAGGSYTLAWSNVPAGSYSLRARAVDNQGASADSAPVAVTVSEPAPPPVAAGVYYIYADHLNTPRVITDGSNKIVWRWDSDPFGADAANEDPDGDGQKFRYNLRFPGQYYDKETGLHYNYFRDYEPSTGRYLTSDPIGLAGGLNTYTYVGSNPLYWVDPLGLDAIPIAFPDYRISTPAGRIGGLGHAGILLIDPQSGFTQYYEYGRYDNQPGQCGCGEVRQPPGGVPNVVMGIDGRPTTDSLNRVLDLISRQAGHGGRISGAYVQNNRFNDMNDYARQRMAQNADLNRQRYSLTGNNCAHFMRDVLEAGGVDTPWMIDPRPNSYIDELRNVFPPINFNPRR